MENIMKSWDNIYGMHRCTADFSI